MRPAPPHCDAAHAAITTELGRLVLGGRPARPELTDWQRYIDTRTRRKPARRRRTR